MGAPSTPKEDVREVIHGVEVCDPYRWLEDTEGDAVQAWLDEQDAYARSVLDSLPYRSELEQEFENLFRKETVEFPSPRGGRYFFAKRRPHESLYVLYVKEGLDGEPRVLVDPNKLSEEAGHPVNLTSYSTTGDGRLITYCISEAANDQSTLCVMDVDTGEKLADEIPGEFYPGTGSWSLDDKGFWYSRRKDNTPKGEEKFHRKLYYHRLGTDFSEDKLVFGEDLKKEDVVGASEIRVGKKCYLVVSVTISSEEYRRSEIYVAKLRTGKRKFRIPKKYKFVPIVKGVKDDYDVRFGMSVHRDYAYISTNYKAPRGKVMRVPFSKISRGMKKWEEVIPEPEGSIISTKKVQDSIFVLTMENVHSVLREYSLDGEFRREVSLPALGTVSAFSAESEGREAFLGFCSFAHPFSVYRMDFDTDETTLLGQEDVDVDVDSIQTRQVWYTSKDGTRVPMFLIHKKGLEVSGDNPTLLYGYGGFNNSLEPYFMSSIIPFIERGGVYVIANLRGGGEFGEEWHKAGTKKQKQNVFDDFISAAEWLIENKYTNPERLAIEGGSNGGLLVGAVMTQRPELFKAVVMSVPVADMLRYHLFHGGRHWIPDYGSAEDPEMFPYLLEYSPYHNVRDEVEYPATMVVTSDQDDRVHPGQAFKMTARLQEASASDNPVILRLERKAGHGGAADIERSIKSLVDEWSFIFRQLGV